MSLFGFLLIAAVALFAWRWALSNQRSRDDERGTVIDASDRFGDGPRAGPIETTPAFPLASIEHPVTAAATLIRYVVGAETWPMVQGRVRAALTDVSSVEAAEEAIQYADWAPQQSIGDDQAVSLLIESLRERLTLDERQDFVRMLEDAALSGDHDVQARASREAIRLIN
ncbi:MAG: hypothetical protein AAGI89_14855 [Pseudomonadota bacterium]